MLKAGHRVALAGRNAGTLLATARATGDAVEFLIIMATNMPYIGRG